MLLTLLITSQFALDDFGKFYDQYHFTRVTADPLTTGANGVIENVSPLEQNQPYILKVYGQYTSWSSEENTTKSNISSYGFLQNNDGNKLSAGGSAGDNNYILASLNNTQPTDLSGATVSGAMDYLLCIFDAKTNKLFLNCTNNSQ